MARENVPSVDTSVDDAINALQNNDADTNARVSALETIVGAISQGQTFSQLVLGIVAAAGYVVGNDGSPNTVPDAPTEIVVSSPGPNEALISFTPGDDGGSPITSFIVMSDTNYSATGTSSPIDLQQLPAGPYNFTVMATNALGSGPASSSVFIQITDPVPVLPDPPTNVIAAGSPGAVTLTWTTPANTGGLPINYYDITSFGPTQNTTTAGGTSTTISGLVPGSYSFTIQTVTNNGVSALSGISNIVSVATTNTVPDAPTNVTATGGTLQSSITFIAPVNNGGTSITVYTVNSSSGAITTGTSSPIVVTEPLVGTYTYTVSATNAIGTGASSTVSNTTNVIGTAPGAPTNVVATGQILQALVSFVAPSNTGGSAIIGYTVASSSGTTANGTHTPITITEVSAGNYTYRVTATNAYGTSSASAASASVTVNPAVTVPGAPTGVSATGGVLQSTVAFTPPSNNGGATITGYVVTSSSGATTSGNNSPISVAEPTAGSYTYTVHAINSAGAGANSTASGSVTVTGLSVPGAPTSVVATGGALQSSVAFTAPASNGGSAITSYTATSSSGATQSGTGSPLIVSEVTAGSFTYTVKATNVVGNSTASTASAAVTVTAVVPGVPNSVSATGGVLQSIVSFSAPTFNGGSAITAYTVLSSSGATATASTSPITVTETAGTYTYKVRATNVAGNGPYSGLTSGTTVTTNVTVPGAPTGVSATGGTLQATVSFTAPSSNGNATIIGYNVYSSSGATASGASSPIVITEPAAGSFTYVVRAVNSAGSSLASTASAATTVSPVVVTATNILPGTTADTTIGPSGFFAVGLPGSAPTLSSDSSVYLAGTTSLKAVATSTSTFYVTSDNFAAVTPGQTITLLAWVRPGTAANTGRLSVNYFNSSYTALSGSTASADTTLSNTTWTGLSYTTTVPSGAAFANIQINIDTAPTVGAVFNFDNLEIAVSSTVNTWTAGLQVPGAPTGIAATGGAGTASVSFTPPSNTGSTAIDSYTVTLSN